MSNYKTWSAARLRVGGYPNPTDIDPNGPLSDYDVFISVTDEWQPEIQKQLRAQGCYAHYWFPMGEMRGTMSLSSIYGALIILHKAELNGLSVYLHCFLPGTLIGAEVPMPVEEAKGRVIGHTGRLQHVVNNFSREYDGQTIVVKATGTLPLQTTPNHKLLVLRAYRFPNGKVAKPGHFDHVTPVAAWYNRTPEWIRADELQKGDYLLSAQWKPEIHSPFDADVAWVLGLFAADGNVDKNGLNYTLGIRSDYKRVILGLEKLGYTAFVMQETPTYRRIRVNSRKAAQQFLDWFGRGAANKHLPACLMHADPAAVVAGVMAGDGSMHPRGNGSRALTSISKTLTYQVWQLVLAQGYKPYMRTVKRHTGYPNAKQLYTVEWTEPSGAHSKTAWWKALDGTQYYIMPITEISEQHYAGLVYNFEVDEVNSYHVQGIAVHNCSAGINRSQTVADCYHYMREEGLTHREKHTVRAKVRGLHLNALQTNCEYGVLPPLDQIERWLLRVGEQFGMTETSSFDYSKPPVFV